MRQTHPEVNLLIQPVGGIANWGLRNHSTAEIHFAPLRYYASKQLHLPVLNPIYPTNFGVFGATAKMSKNYARDMDDRLAPYPNAKVLFIFHSFGGILGLESMLNSNERERFIGALTLGTPHLGVEVGKWKGFERTEKNINAFAADVRAGHVQDGNRIPLALVGTALDIMVPPASALPDIPGKQRHLFALPGTSHSELGKLHTHLNTGVEHAGLIAHPHSLVVITGLARQMIKSQRDLPPLARAA